jgi:SecD/SecF fusion protein
MTALGSETIERVGNDPEALQEVLQERYATAFRSPRAFSSSNFLSASEAVRTVGRAMIAIFLSLFGIVAYVWLRFGNIRFGLAAILALVHDVLITMGLVALADMLSPTPIGELLFIGDVKIGLATVAAFLTLIGYSLNDTIVVFDRIRENITGGRKLVPDIVNNSINQMLGRTILTSVTTLIVVLVQYIWGGPSIHSLCFVLICGVVVGTYSSIFIASPVLIWGALWGRSRE